MPISEVPMASYLFCNSRSNIWEYDSFLNVCTDISYAMTLIFSLLQHRRYDIYGCNEKALTGSML